MTGKNNKVKNIYGEGYSQFEFVDKMDYAFLISDACISRAGSNAVFELLSEKIPTLLIPLPKAASRGDQILNAKYFTAKGLTSMIYQEDLTPESLIYNVNLLIKAKEEIKKRIPNFDKKTTFYKVCARGTLDKKLTIDADDLSIEAKKMILLTGGKVIVSISK